MLRGYRCIVIAAFGWLILIAANKGQLAPQAVTGSQAPTERNANGKAAKATPQGTSAPEAPEAASQDAGCPDGQDRRDSDLCAQWKAADAAFDAARAGRQQLVVAWLGLVLGGVTMFAAIAAAFYAKRAAIATEGTLADAERATAAQLRPYVFFAPQDSVLTDPFQFENNFAFRFPVKNYGSIPAEYVTLYVGQKVVTLPIGNQAPEMEKGHSLGRMAPGAQRPIAMLNGPHFGLQLKDLKEGRAAQLFKVRVEYTWTGGSDSDELDLWTHRISVGKENYGHRLTQDIRENF